MNCTHRWADFTVLKQLHWGLGVAKKQKNKIASLEATLVRNSAHSLTYSLTGVKCRATSVAENEVKFTQTAASAASTRRPRLQNSTVRGWLGFALLLAWTLCAFFYTLYFYTHILDTLQTKTPKTLFLSASSSHWPLIVRSSQWSLLVWSSHWSLIVWSSH